MTHRTASPALGPSGGAFSLPPADPGTRSDSEGPSIGHHLRAPQLLDYPPEVVLAIPGA